MSEADDYRPCRHCGELTDSGVCSPECADALEAAIDAEVEDGNDEQE